MVVDLQTIVSREIEPSEPAVVTVGSIHGGTKHNIIPDEVKLQLTLRTFSEPVRLQLIAGIKRRVDGAGQGPPGPRADGRSRGGTPPTINTPALVERVVPAFVEALGSSNVKPAKPVMGAEDFALLQREGTCRSACSGWARSSPERLEAARSQRQRPAGPALGEVLPRTRPSIATGIRAMTAAVVKLLPRKS